MYFFRKFALLILMTLAATTMQHPSSFAMMNPEEVDLLEETKKNLLKYQQEYQQHIYLFMMLFQDFNDSTAEIYKNALLDPKTRMYALIDSKILSEYIQYLKHNQKGDQALALFAEAVRFQKDPNGTDLLFAARYYFDHGETIEDLERSLAYYLKLFNHDDYSKKHIFVTDFLNIAQTYYYLQQYDHAATYFDHAILHLKTSPQEEIIFNYKILMKLMETYNLFSENFKNTKTLALALVTHFLDLLKTSKNPNDIAIKLNKNTLLDLDSNKKKPHTNLSNKQVRKEFVQSRAEIAKNTLKEIDLNCPHINTISSPDLLKAKHKVIQQGKEINQFYSKISASPSINQVEKIRKMTENLDQKKTDFYIECKKFKNSTPSNQSVQETHLDFIDSDINLSGPVNLKAEVLAEHKEAERKRQEKEEQAKEYSKEREAKREEMQLEYQIAKEKEQALNQETQSVIQEEALIHSFLPQSFEDLNQEQAQILLQTLQEEFDLKGDCLDVAEIILLGGEQKIPKDTLLSFFEKIGAKLEPGKGSHVKIIGAGYTVSVSQSFSEKEGTYHSILDQARKVLIEMIRPKVTQINVTNKKTD